MEFETQTAAIETSVVIPCLNEEDTLGSCIEKAWQALREHNIAGEIIVADNGSTDSSRTIAENQGARIVMVKEPGYGSALMGGIAAAKGRFVIIGDADASYDLLEIPKIVKKLREGFDLVQGCRLPAGGGSIQPGAMPFLHRWIGNPLFSFLVRRWFNAPINDVYCGLRGFSKAMYQRLDQRCTGMEFATEMIIKASLHGEKIVEVPITLYPDGRRSHAPHLKTFRDGWRTFRYFLMCSPRWLFLVPSGVFIAFGLLGYLVAMPGLSIGRSTFDAHTLLFASLAILCGYQCILFAIFAKTFAVTEGFLPPDRHLERFFEVVNLEKGLVVAALALLAGGGLLLAAIRQWWLTGFGHLDYAYTCDSSCLERPSSPWGFKPFSPAFSSAFLGCAENNCTSDKAKLHQRDLRQFPFPLCQRNKF